MLKPEYWALIDEGRFAELDKMTNKVCLTVHEWMEIEDQRLAWELKHGDGLLRGINQELAQIPEIE